MKVFKFGGASVKDSAGVRRVASVLSFFSQDDILVVVSAMGKSTNALEKIVGFYIAEDRQSCNESVMQLEKYHFDIIADLNFPSDALIFTEINQLFTQLKLKLGIKINGGFNRVYDQIVSFGELLSTKIVSAHLNHNSYTNLWLDARQLIKTDQNYRFARVNWLDTERMLKESVQIGARYLTQGFIASDDMGNTTTLGREG
jgi:aspartate kinase